MSRTVRIIRIVSAIGMALALGLLAACAQTAPSDGSGAQTADPAPSVAAPTLRLIVPENGATVPTGTVKVAVETTGLEFVMPSNTNVAGQGHVHFTLDDRPFIMSVEKEAEFEDVEPGTHRLVAELVQNNTDSFDPPITQEVEFVVE